MPGNRKELPGNSRRRRRLVEMIVVFDSNIWLKELGLKSGAGSAACFYLNHHEAQLAIPEVVRLEVEHNLRNRLLEHIDQIEASYDQLLTAFGKLREVVLPTADEVEEKVDELFSSLDVDRLEVPFSLESARSALLKSIRKVPPSKTKQQFKDGVVWADCLSLLESDDVTLVTGDTDFYEGRKYQNGLAANLKAEAVERPNGFTILPSLTDLLESLHTEIPLDQAKLAEAFFNEYEESIERILDRNDFELRDRLDTTYALFATEKPDLLFLKFTMHYECTDVTDQERLDAILRLKGDGSYNPGTGSFQNLRNFGEHLSYQMPDGTVREQENHNIFGASISLGHREVSHTVRYRLDDSGNG